MNDDAFFVASLQKMFEDLCPAEGVAAAEAEWPARMWAAFEDAGLTLISIPDRLGGSGGTEREALLLLHLAGRFACPLPLAETAFLAGWIVSRAGLALVPGPLTLAADRSIRFDQSSGRVRVRGRAVRVPWARASRIVVVGNDDEDVMLTMLDPSECYIEGDTNLAGEPRDTVELDVLIDRERIGAVEPPLLYELQLRGAIARTMMMAGALARVVELSVLHSTDRVQFGRPIAKFQAIQHYLAIMAGEAAVANAAGDALMAAFGEPGVEMVVAAAKTCVGEAATTVSSLAHQIHGAIGITREHSLQLYTRRLLAWRDEYGSEFQWAYRLGDMFSGRASDDVWTALTSTL